MYKLRRIRIRELALATLLLFASCFLSFSLLAHGEAAYAEDDTPIRNVTDEFFVTIYDQGQSLIVKTAETTVGEVLSRAGILIAETDIVEPALETVITSDFNINIYRARPALVVVGLERRFVMTASYDAKQIAGEAGFTVYDGDTFTNEFNSSFLEAGAVSTYRLHRNGGRTLTLEEVLPYTTETRYDYNLAKGESYLEQAGEDGRKRSVYDIEFSEGVEIARTLASEEIIVAPVPEIVIVGAKLNIPPEREQCAGWAREAGVAEEDLEAALELMYHESNCRTEAVNAGSGAYGIPQALPGEKMAAFGDDWQTNPITQIRWMAQYVNDRYGGWQSALNFWWCTGVCSTRYTTITKNSYWY